MQLRITQPRVEKTIVEQIISSEPREDRREMREVSVFPVRHSFAEALASFSFSCLEIITLTRGSY